jgi:HK97 family phage prohead protease
MPWEIKEQDGKQCVFKQGESSPIPGGCHNTLEEATRHMSALYSSETVKGDISWEDRLGNVRRAVWRLLDAISSPQAMNAFLVNVYDEYLILSWGEKYYRVGYTEEGTVVTLEPSTAWKLVELQWVAAEEQSGTPPASKSTTPDALLKRSDVIWSGGGVKATTKRKGGIEGYLLRFTDENSPDLQGEFFTRDTFLDIEDGERVTFYYQHGQDPVLGKRVLGKGVAKVDEVGLWIEGQLELRDAYEKAIYKLVQEGKLGFSSGTLPFLVEYERKGGAYWIKSWPVGKDASLTVCPVAGPGLTTVDALKGMRLNVSQEEAGDASEAEALHRLSLEVKLMELEG